MRLRRASERPDEREVLYSSECRDVLRLAPWARPLERPIDNRGLEKADPSLRFELRVGRLLSDRSPAVQYEWPTGVGGSTVDFRVVLGKDWLIELTEVVMAYEVDQQCNWHATSDPGVFRRAVHLGSGRDHEHRHLTPEGDSMRLRDKIVEKARKFPAPGERVHAVLVRANSFQLGAADIDDWLQLAYGPEAVREEAQLTFQGNEVAGLFAPANDDTRTLRERVHLVGFARERDFAPDEIARRAIWARNPELVASTSKAQDLLDGGPLKGGFLLDPLNFK